MGVTVVRGIATSQSGASAAESPASLAASTSAQIQASSAATNSTGALTQATRAVSSEAAISHIRATKFTNSTEKLRDYGEAHSNAYEIADRIKGEGDALAAHGDIDSVSAREHLAG